MPNPTADGRSGGPVPLSADGDRSIVLPVASLVAVCAILLLGLFGWKQYPVNDDWSFIRAAEAYHETGKIRLTDWTAMSLVFQLWWARGFTALFGCSIEILRLSTIVLSMIGIVCFYLLLRDHGVSPGGSVIGTSLFLFNPFTFPLLFTFFTDPSFVSLLVLSSCLYYKAFRSGADSRLLLLGSLAASCAILVRQIGIFIPAAVVACLLANRKDTRDFLRKAALASALPAITLAVFSYWLVHVHGTPPDVFRHGGPLLKGIANPLRLLEGIPSRAVLVFDFLGFSLIPVAVAAAAGKVKPGGRRHAVALLVCCGGGVAWMLASGTADRAAALQLSDGFPYAYMGEYGVRKAPAWLDGFVSIMTALSAASGLYLVWRGIETIRTSGRRLDLKSPETVLFAIALAQCLFLLVVPFKLTRYFLVLLPFSILLAMKLAQRLEVGRIPLALGLAPYVLWSLAVTADFMSWNQVKWQSAKEIADRGIPDREISAGFAWDCYHNWTFESDPVPGAPDRQNEIPWWIRNLVPDIAPRYIVSSSTMPTSDEGTVYFRKKRWKPVDVDRYRSAYFGRRMEIYQLKGE